jgi:hypothetical protein
VEDHVNKFALLSCLLLLGCSAPLHDAAERNDVEGIRHALDVEKINVNETSFGLTALHEASISQSVEAVAYLLERGADPNRGSSGNTRGIQPLHFAVGGRRYAWQENSLEKQLRIVDLLVDAGANPNGVFSWGVTPMHHVLDFQQNKRSDRKKDCFALAIRLVERGADPNQEDSVGYTPVEWAQSKHWLDGLLGPAFVAAVGVAARSQGLSNADTQKTMVAAAAELDGDHGAMARAGAKAEREANRTRRKREREDAEALRQSDERIKRQQEALERDPSATAGPSAPPVGAHGKECPGCAKLVKTRAKFCRYCGHSFKKEAATALGAKPSGQGQGGAQANANTKKRQAKKGQAARDTPTRIAPRVKAEDKDGRWQARVNLMNNTYEVQTLNDGSDRDYSYKTNGKGKYRIVSTEVLESTAGYEKLRLHLVGTDGAEDTQVIRLFKNPRTGNCNGDMARN